MTLRRRLRIGAVLTTASVLAVGALTAGPAHAAQAAGYAPLPTVDMTSAAGTTTTVEYRRTAGGVGVLDTIRCTIVAQSPEFVGWGQRYGRHTVPINSFGGTVYVTCTASIPEINLRAALFWNGVQESFEEAPRLATGFAQADTVAGCVGGGWITAGSAFLLAPVGYSPRTAIIRTQSPTAYFSNLVC
jgi:hypothetical protein